MTIKQAFKLQKFLRCFMPWRLALWITKRAYRIFRVPQPFDAKVKLHKFIKGCAGQGLIKRGGNEQR